MTKIVAIPLGYLMNGIYGLVDNYALSIIIMTVIIRLIILPLYSMQLKSNEQMMAVQPKIKEIQTKYKDNPEKMNQKLQELYENHKIRPAMGCLPLLIQLPIIWGLFALLRNPMDYISNTDMVIAVHESCFWINDLTQPDMWILPIIAGVATYISMKITTVSSQGNNSANATMKAMQYFMPVMIVWMGRTLPAGLCMYWIMSYIFQIVQTKVIQMRKKARDKKAQQAK